MEYVSMMVQNRESTEWHNNSGGIADKKLRVVNGGAKPGIH
jgi:hypothetical protein